MGVALFSKPQVSFTYPYTWKKYQQEEKRHLFPFIILNKKISLRFEELNSEQHLNLRTMMH